MYLTRLFSVVANSQTTSCCKVEEGNTILQQSFATNYTKANYLLITSQQLTTGLFQQAEDNVRHVEATCCESVYLIDLVTR